MKLEKLWIRRNCFWKKKILIVLINVIKIAYFCRYIKVIVKKTSRIFENLIT